VGSAALIAALNETDTIDIRPKSMPNPHIGLTSQEAFGANSEDEASEPITSDEQKPIASAETPTPKVDDTTNETIGQKNAVSTAKSYLSFSAFSREGLIKQLEFDGFTSEEATVGANNCGANWNEQAAKQAKSYLEISSFSRDSLIQQLEFEGFTYEQAVYGVKANGFTE